MLVRLLAPADHANRALRRLRVDLCAEVEFDGAAGSDDFVGSHVGRDRLDGHNDLSLKMRVVKGRTSDPELLTLGPGSSNASVSGNSRHAVPALLR